MLRTVLHVRAFRERQASIVHLRHKLELKSAGRPVHEVCGPSGSRDDVRSNLGDRHICQTFARRFKTPFRSRTSPTASHRQAVVTPICARFCAHLACILRSTSVVLRPLRAVRPADGDADFTKESGKGYNSVPLERPISAPAARLYPVPTQLTGHRSRNRQDHHKNPRLITDCYHGR